MAITPVGTAGVAGGNLATITPTWPSGVASGDLAVLVWTNQSTLTETVPTGFTLRSQNTGTGSVRSSVYYKILTGSESGTLSLTMSAANRHSATLSVHRGVDNTTPIEAISSFVESVSGTTHTSPAVTLVTANAALMVAASERSSTGTNDWTVPSGYIERADTTTLATGTGGSITAVARENPDVNRTAGTVVTPGVWTSGNAFATTNVITWSLALRQATVSNVSPTANAGSDQANVEPGTTVTLNGSGSSDSDGTIASYAWTQTGGSPTVTLSGSGATRTFTAPLTVAGTTLTFSLTVTDNLGATSAADTMTVAVLPAAERIMVAGSWVPALLRIL